MAVTYRGIQIKGVYCLLNGFFFSKLTNNNPNSQYEMQENRKSQIYKEKVFTYILTLGYDYFNKDSSEMEY